MKKAIFLDRDGTINEDPGYLNHPDQIRLFDGVGDALRTMQDAGYELFIVTNQSGIARGFLREQDLTQIHAEMDRILKDEFGVQIRAFLYCKHHPQEGCECRKPKPKLFFQAAERYGISLASSWVIGDRISDVRAGVNAGLKGSVLVLTGLGEENFDLVKDFKADDFFNFSTKDLLSAAKKIRETDSQIPSESTNLKV